MVLLGHGFWSREFGADPGLIGRALSLDGEPHTVIGVLTPRIEVGSLSEIDLWTPLAPVADPQDREARTLRVTGRLARGGPGAGAGRDANAGAGAGA